MASLPASIHTFSQYAHGFGEWRAIGAAANPASANWPAANLAIYIPIEIPFAFPVANAAWFNGSAGGGNVDFGIFSAATGAKLASTGSTAQSGTSVLQTAALSYTMSPGRYYFGLSCSATTNALFLNTTVTALIGRQLGVLQEASAVPLPSSMTPATFANTGYPICGVIR